MTRYYDLYERIIANTHEPVGGSGCWIWKGRVTRNYPRMSLRLPGRPHPIPVAPHRVMCELRLGLPVGWLPPYIEVDHLCKHPWCVNPEHLEACAQGVNQRRRSGYDCHCGISWLPIDDIVI